MWERRNCLRVMCMRNPETLLPFKYTRKKRIVIDTATLKDSFKENSMLFDFSPKSIMNVPKLLPQKDSLLSPQLPVSVGLVSIDWRDS